MFSVSFCFNFFVAKILHVVQIRPYKTFFSVFVNQFIRAWQYLINLYIKIQSFGICNYNSTAVCQKCSSNMFFVQSRSHYTILYYTILYYTILYYTILYYTILYYTILYYTILYYTILYYTILYYTILFYTILYYTILCYAMLYYTELYYTILY